MQGYFSLIQYSEFPERYEFVNIGVVLFTDVFPRVHILFSDSFKRVEQSFGISIGKHFMLQKESMEKRIFSEFSNQWEKPNIDRFLAIRSSKFRLSSLRSVLVKADPDIFVKELLNDFVGGITYKPREQQVKTKLKQNLKSLAVEELLDKKPDPISLPQGVTVKAVYGYQNGSYNMINPISLRDTPDKALKNASSQAIEGKWLIEHSKNQGKHSRLIVVGDLEGQQHNFVQAIKELMLNNEVDFHPLDQLHELANDIRKNAPKTLNNTLITRH